jgi:hypothetical protein
MRSTACGALRPGVAFEGFFGCRTLSAFREECGLYPARATKSESADFTRPGFGPQRDLRTMLAAGWSPIALVAARNPFPRFSASASESLLGW